jgi:hypothetical protein
VVVADMPACTFPCGCHLQYKSVSIDRSRQWAHENKMTVAQSVSRKENPSKPAAAHVTFALIPQRNAQAVPYGCHRHRRVNGLFSIDVLAKNDMRRTALSLEFQKLTDHPLMR